MAGESFIRVPDSVDDPLALRRFLLALVEYLDVAFGNRGDNVADVNTAKQFLSTVTAAEVYLTKKDATQLYTKNPQQTSISQLGLTITNPPTQIEVQTISDKVDQVIAALTLAKII